MAWMLRVFAHWGWGHFTLSSLRGAVGDLVFAAGFALIALPLARYALVPWAALLALNTRHIAVNQSHLDIQFLHLGIGPVLKEAVGDGLLWMLLVGSLALGGWVFHHCRRLSWHGPLSLAIAGFVLLSLWSPSPHAPLWSSTHWAEYQILGHRLYTGDRLLGENLADRFFFKDLTGSPLPELSPFPRPGSNVLVIFLEGVGHSAIYPETFPHLIQWAAGGLHFPNFAFHNRQTNRNLYSALCGDLPNLLATSAKPDLMVTGQLSQECLPKHLQDNGYRTVFLQGADLAFMQKDALTARMGFEIRLGHRSFDPNVGSHGRWGVDDKTLLQKAESLIADLHQDQKPWLMTILTSGTHLQVNIPPSFEPHRHREIAALRYADQALHQLLRALRSQRILDNTLVLITGDEVGPITVGDDDTTPWPGRKGFLVALVPGGATKRVDSLYGHVDLALSVSDYLNTGFGTVGRSLFRSYPASRSLLVADVFQKNLFRVDSDGTVIRCQAGAWCHDGSNPLSREEVQRLAALVQFSDHPADPRKELLDVPHLTVPTSSRPFNSLFFSLPKSHHLRLTATLKAPKSNRQPAHFVFHAREWDSKPKSTPPLEDIIIPVLPGSASTVTRFLASPGESIRIRGRLLAMGNPSDQMVLENLTLTLVPDRDLP